MIDLFALLSSSTCGLNYYVLCVVCYKRFVVNWSTEHQC